MKDFITILGIGYIETEGIIIIMNIIKLLIIIS